MTKDPREGNERAETSAIGHPRWSSRGPRGARAGSFQYLLDLDVDLAEALDVQIRMAARPAATAMTFDADPGEIRLAEKLVAAAPGPGVLVLSGVLAVNLRVGDRTASELLGTGDLIQPVPRDADDLVACEVEWRGLEHARFALLDGGFAQRVRPWPQIMQMLLRRTERRVRSLNVQRSIASQPRLEVRLALLLWHLAGRWGRVEPGGIRLPLPLTHQLLGHLVGAERPSVSHALSRLSRAGLVTGHGDEWHLHGRIEEQLEGMLDAPVVGVRPLASARSRR